MRIGLDIASMAFKQKVTQMILISGDSDFVPAAKIPITAMTMSSSIKVKPN